MIISSDFYRKESIKVIKRFKKKIYSLPGGAYFDCGDLHDIWFLLDLLEKELKKEDKIFGGKK